MLDYLLEDNDVWPLCRQQGLSDVDLVFIKELILGHPLPPSNKFQGRSPNKHFLYQIVSNDETKVDVDKFDYILRDCRQLNITTGFEHERVFQNSRVFFLGKKLGGDEQVIEVASSSSVDECTPTTIAYRKKISEALEDLFRGRSSLHQKAYQHRVTKIVEEM